MLIDKNIFFLKLLFSISDIITEHKVYKSLVTIQDWPLVENFQVLLPRHLGLFDHKFFAHLHTVIW